MSQVKLKHQSVNSQADGIPSDYDMGNGSNRAQQDAAVHRRLSLRRSSNSISKDSNNLAGRLDSVKKYAEDDYMMQGAIDILGNSSISILDAKASIIIAEANSKSSI